MVEILLQLIMILINIVHACQQGMLRMGGNRSHSRIRLPGMYSGRRFGCMQSVFQPEKKAMTVMIGMMAGALSIAWCLFRQ